MSVQWWKKKSCQDIRLLMATLIRSPHLEKTVEYHVGVQRFPTAASSADHGVEVLLPEDPVREEVQVVVSTGLHLPTWGER